MFNLEEHAQVYPAPGWASVAISGVSLLLFFASQFTPMNANAAKLTVLSHCCYQFLFSLSWQEPYLCSSTAMDVAASRMDVVRPRVSPISH